MKIRDIKHGNKLLGTQHELYTEKFLPNGGRVIKIKSTAKFVSIDLLLPVSRANKPSWRRGSLPFGGGSIIYVSERGKLHREDGPAITYPDGTKKWYLHGKVQKQSRII